MTADVIPLNRGPKKPATKFTFTKSALKDWVAKDVTDIILRDADCLGLILRRQKAKWTFAIERRINGKLFRQVLRDYHSGADLKALRAEATEIMVAVRNESHETPTERRQAIKAAQQAGDLAVMTVGQTLDLYRRNNPQVRASTVESYAYNVARLENLSRTKDDPQIVDFVIDRSTLQMSDLDTATVRSAYDRVCAERSAATGAQMLRSVHALWQHWADEHPEGQEPTRAPTKALTKKRGRVAKVAPRDGVLSVAERPLWRAAAQSEADSRGPTGTTAQALLFLFLTGLRRDEALSLRWSDIVGDTLTIPADRMKAGVALSRPITPGMRAVLDAQKKWHPNSPWVFPASRGDGHAVEARKTMRVINEAAGTSITNHDLRRTYIVAGQLAGLPDVAVKLLVGHATADVTEAYAAAIRTELPALTAKVEAELMS